MPKRNTAVWYEYVPHPGTDDKSENAVRRAVINGDMRPDMKTAVMAAWAARPNLSPREAGLPELLDRPAVPGAVWRFLAAEATYAPADTCLDAAELLGLLENNPGGPRFLFACDVAGECHEIRPIRIDDGRKDLSGMQGLRCFLPDPWAEDSDHGEKQE